MLLEILPNYHPILVHFTVAMLTISTLFFIVAVMNNNSKNILMTAYINLWVGIVITIFTLLLGFIAYYTVGYNNSHDLLVMQEHRNWGILTLLLYLFIGLLSIFSYYKNIKYKKLWLCLLILANIILGIASYKGGELVYKYGIGTMHIKEN